MDRSTTVFLLSTAATLFSFATVLRANPRSQTVLLVCRNPHAGGSTLHVSNFITNMAKISEQMTSSGGFGMAMTGSPPDQSYALAQCYGDLSFVDCAMCYSQARTTAPMCNNNYSTQLHLDGCFLRADTYDFFKEETGPDDTVVCGGAQQAGDDPSRAFRNSATEAVMEVVRDAPRNGGYARAVARAAYVLGNCWRSLSAEDCAACLANASASVLKCLPRWSEGRAANAGCFLRYSHTDFLNSDESLRKGSATTVMMVVAIVSSSLALLIGGAIGFYVRKRRFIQNKRKGPKGMKKLMKILKRSGLNFKFSTLEKATGSFDEAMKLGQGGFGVVYKGVLADGREIAIKKLFLNNTQRADDFYNEINIISSMQHKNLVKLLGCSFSGSESFLVYEFLPNQSLDRFIFDLQKGKILNWEKRRKIIIGTAEGLAYLHNNIHSKIIHRDIKASNILLNSKFHAKIADFGLARSFQEDTSHISIGIAGTLGYMAPEYVAQGRLTEKVDVYGFGVLLLEIVTGQQSNNAEISECAGSLVIMAWKQFLQERMEELVDTNLLLHNTEDENNRIKIEALRAIRIGLLCTQAISSLRPTMLKVVEMLMKADEHLLAPTAPPFIEINQIIEALPTTTGDRLNSRVSPSLATMSYSSFGPR